MHFIRCCVTSNQLSKPSSTRRHLEIRLGELVNGRWHCLSAQSVCSGASDRKHGAACAHVNRALYLGRSHVIVFHFSRLLWKSVLSEQSTRQ